MHVVLNMNMHQVELIKVANQIGKWLNAHLESTNMCRKPQIFVFIYWNTEERLEGIMAILLVKVAISSL